jgi:hypothetical protein
MPFGILAVGADVFVLVALVAIVVVVGLTYRGRGDE